MSQSRKDCRQPLQSCRIEAVRGGCKHPEGTIMGRSPGLTCLQSSSPKVWQPWLETTSSNIHSFMSVLPV